VCLFVIVVVGVLCVWGVCEVWFVCYCLDFVTVFEEQMADMKMHLDL